MNYTNHLRINLDAHTFASMAMEFFEEMSISAGHDGNHETAKRYYKTAEELARLTRWIEKNVEGKVRP